MAVWKFEFFENLASKNRSPWTFILDFTASLNFDIDGFGLRDMVKISGQKLSVTMSSDFPGFQFYSSNFLKGEKGKNGMAYPARSAVCLEGEYFPNGINYEDIKDKPIVHAGKPLCHEIRYVISKN